MLGGCLASLNARARTLYYVQETDVDPRNAEIVRGHDESIVPRALHE
jgi:hypothetical protein